MKNITVTGAILILALIPASAMAANNLSAGTAGLNVGATDSFIINGKYFVAKDMAILGGFGLRIAGGDAKGTDIGFLAGVRKYLKSDDLAPFVGGRFEYASTNDSNVTAMGFQAEAGAEYFLAKEFSIEGRIGFGYQSQDTTTINPNTAATTKMKVTQIGTGSVAISANFYF